MCNSVRGQVLFFMMKYKKIVPELASKTFNPIALRTAKTLWSFGCSECSRVKVRLAQVGYIKLFIICIFSSFLIFNFIFYFNSQCLASLETNFFSCGFV